MNEPLSLFKKKVLLQWLAFAAVLLAVGAYHVFNLASEYTDVGAAEEHRLKTQANVIDRNLDQELKTTNAALGEILKNLHYWKTPTGWSEAATIHLTALANAMPGVRTFTLIDRNGIITASNRQELVGLDVSKRDYFKLARNAPSQETLFISPPFRSVLDVFIIGASRMIPGANGQFDGVVNASLDPSYFSTLLDSVLYAPDMWASLAHSSGILFLMNPDRAGVSGKDLARPNTFFTRHIESGNNENVFSGTVYATNEDRLLVTRSIKPEELRLDHFFVLAVSRDVKAVYAGWRYSAIRESAILTAIAFFAALFLAAYQRHSLQFERERLASKHALERSLQEFNDLVTQVPAGFYRFRMLAGGGWRFDYVSPRFCQTLDVAEDEVLRDAERAFARIHPDDSAHFVHLNEESRKTRNPFEWEGRILSGKNEVRWLRISSRPTLLENGDILWNGMLYDVTDQKELLESLRNSNAELEQFAYVASHDLREPLRMVSGFVSLLAKRYSDKLDQDAMEFIGFAIDGVKRMDMMINDLLEYSRIGRTEKPFEDVPLNDAVTDAIMNLKAALAATQGKVEIAGDLPHVLGDKGRLVRLFQNLIGNALKYHAAGKPPLVTLSAKRDGERWVVTVADNGIGIAPEHQDRIFGIFQRLHSHQKYEGTGIGLAICRKIAEHHGGRIWVESEEGKGSRFHVGLPAMGGT